MVEHLGFVEPGADRSKQPEGALVVRDRLLVPPQPDVRVADAVRRVRLARVVAEPPVQQQRTPAEQPRRAGVEPAVRLREHRAQVAGDVLARQQVQPAARVGELVGERGQLDRRALHDTRGQDRQCQW